MKILLVDDELEYVQLIEELISNVCSVEIVGDSRVAIEQIKDRTYDFIVTDLNMPGIHGLELIAEIKKSATNYRTPTLILSGFIDSNLERLTRLNLVEVLSKSMRIDEIAQTILARVAACELKTYNKKILDLFYEAARSVLQHFFGGEPIDLGAFVQERDEKFSPFLVTMISLVGDQLSGTVVLSVDRLFMEKFVGNLFKDQEIGHISDDQYVEYIGELANQIAGKFKRHILQYSLTTQLGIPVSFIGNPRMSMKNHNVPIYIPGKIGESKSYIRVDISPVADQKLVKDDSEDVSGSVLF